MRTLFSRELPSGQAFGDGFQADFRDFAGCLSDLEEVLVPDVFVAGVFLAASFLAGAFLAGGSVASAFLLGVFFAADLAAAGFAADFLGAVSPSSDAEPFALPLAAPPRLFSTLRRSASMRSSTSPPPSFSSVLPKVAS